MTDNFFVRLAHESRGQDLIEYGLMCLFVAVAAAAIVPGIAQAVMEIIHIPVTATSIRIAAAILAVVVLGAVVHRRREGVE